METEDDDDATGAETVNFSGAEAEAPTCMVAADFGAGTANTDDDGGEWGGGASVMSGDKVQLCDAMMNHHGNGCR